MKVFSFEDKVPGSVEDLSFATLSTKAKGPLPSSFVVCLSHRQSRWDGVGFFYLTDEEDQSWLSMRWQLDFGRIQVKLWLGSPATVLYLGDVEEPVLNYWYTDCLGIDTATMKVYLSVNGRIISNGTNIKTLESRRPGVLQDHLHLGVWHHHKWVSEVEQFAGEVTNVQVYSGLSHLLEETCGRRGDFLAWQDMAWRNTGEGMRIKEVPEESICHPEDTYELAFPFRLSQPAALQVCHKLGPSTMSAATNQEELEAYTEWFKGVTPQGDCGYIWTPFSDEDTEGNYTNLDDGTLATYLPWHRTDPNGGTVQNSVAIRVALMPAPYFDTYPSFTNCFSCVLNVTVQIKWFGACQDTYLGNFVFLTRIYDSSFFLQKTSLPL